MATGSSVSSSSDALSGFSSPLLTGAPIDTPPSSPPTFQWHSQENAKESRSLDKPVTSALSILGKRKAVLQETSHNGRKAKRIHVANTTNATGMKQMQLSLGQKIEHTCKDCNMVYVLSSAEDRKLHEVFHDRTQRGCEVGPEFVRRSTVDDTYRVSARTRQTVNEDIICRVTRTQPKWRLKHARAVLDIITSSLGACIIPDQELWAESNSTPALNGAFEMLLYIRQGRCIAALVLEGLTHEVRKFMRPANKTNHPNSAVGLDALARLRARRAAEKALDPKAWQPSEETYHAIIGISRIWTAPACRGEGLATSLLDCVYHRLLKSSAVDDRSRIKSIAFSQPTEAGIRLARKWFGQQYGWYVY